MSIAVVLAVCAAAHVVAARLSWSGIPLQTDTGMWAYIGRRILDGALPYRDLWESKPPGIYYTFAVVERVFGVGGDRALLWTDAVVSLAVLGVTYVVARRFASRAAAAGAVLLLSIVFCHRVLADWGDNVEKFVALFEMCACYMVLRGLEEPRASARAASRPPAAPIDEEEPRASEEPRAEPVPTASGAHADPRTGKPGNEWPHPPRLARRGASPYRWLAAGLCCGLAGLFKQTGVVFFAAVILSLVWARARRQTAPHTTVPRIGFLVLGAVLPWACVLAWMGSAGILDEFWAQVVRYDLLRVTAGTGERSRLLTAQHWVNMWRTVSLAGILFGPALVAVVGWVAQGRGASAARGTPNGPSRRAALRLVALYWVLATLVFPFAPYGYGHYLLQAAPPAAVLAAWLFDQAFGTRRSRSWAAAAIVAVLLGLRPLRDHVAFTFDATSPFRRAYAHIRDDTFRRVRLVRQHTRAGQSVMLWRPDYAVSYYAGRSTPLEMSNADVIFKGKVYRLSPPLPELLARLAANPPDVIFERGASLLEDPRDDHPRQGVRVPAPLKRWVRENYGGHERVGNCTIYYRGRPRPGASPPGGM